MSRPPSKAGSSRVASGRTGTTQQQQQQQQPQKAAASNKVEADMLWSHRPGADADAAAAATAAAASTKSKQQQPRQSPLAQDGGYATGESPDVAAGVDGTPANQIAGGGGVTSPKSNNAATNKRQSSPTSAAQQQAAAKAQAAREQATAQTAAKLKTSSAVLGEEVASLKEENAQLRDIERQFWVLLDEREQLMDEVRALKNGISSAHSLSSGGNNNNNNVVSHHHSSSGAGAASSIRAPSDASEAERNYSQMSAALDEALAMLVQLDRTAGSRITGGGSASVVTPGTLISRFLDFCSSERVQGLRSHHQVSSPSANNNNNAGAAASPSSGFVSRTAQMVQSMEESVANRTTVNARSGSNQHNRTPHVITEALSPAAGADSSNIMTSATYATNMSQALRVAQDEIQHLKLELDRSDLSRMQALDDVDKMQSQIKMLSQSVVELRSAYASARAQADSNARAAETVHEVTVRLAERDAEIAHLKARVAEMQRMAASGGTALASDTQRIRQELQSRIAK